MVCNKETNLSCNVTCFDFLNDSSKNNIIDGIWEQKYQLSNLIQQFYA